MVFSSLTFLVIFLPLTLLLYRLLPGKARDVVLLASSLLFYAWGEPVYVLLMLYSILLNYGCGLLMEKEAAHKKQLLIFALVINLFLLGFFKYYGFIQENIEALCGCRLPFEAPELPIGISFYTFQALSYVIDLYRGNYPPQKSLLRFGCYITMFPQLIAGPIVRYENIRPQLEERDMSAVSFGQGCERFVLGLGKKVLLANTAGAMFDALAGQTTVLGGWLRALAFTFQIYFDFSGYSDMAIGLGQLLGFRFQENFDYPYTAASVTDFWRRWHISLSSWFREYVYIPLGGNRKGAFRRDVNLLIVWFLTGLWHGAAWNFVLWGLYFAVLLLIEKPLLGKIKLPAAIGRGLTFVLVVISWNIFSAEGATDALKTTGLLLGIGAAGAFDRAALYEMARYAGFLLVCGFFCLPLFSRLLQNLQEKKALKALSFLLYALIFVLSLVFLVSESYNPFLYFRF